MEDARPSNNKTVEEQSVMVVTQEKIAELQAQMKELKAEVRREELKANAYTMGLDTGCQVSAAIAGLVDGGLPLEMAEKLVLASITGGQFK